MASKERMKQILRLLIERDGFVCGICGGEIIDVFEADVDHIIPKIMGGEDKSQNLQPAHMECNRVKSGNIYPHLKQKPKCAKVDKILKQKEAIVSHYEKEKERIKDKNFDFVSDAIARKQRADAFLDSVIEKNRNRKTVAKPKTESPLRKVQSTLGDEAEYSAPVRLWNEIVRNGFKNLSYNIFLQHFEEYKLS